MTTLLIAAVDTSGVPLAHRTVEVATIAGRAGGHPSAGGPVIVAPVTVRLDETGSASVDVTPTDALDVPGAFVRVTVLGSSPTIVRSLTIPSGPATVDWADPALQVADPVIPEVGVTRHQLDTALADLGHGTSVHGDLAGRDAPGSHPAAAVAVDPADVPFLDPAAFAATVEAQTIAHGAPPEMAASIAASITALVVDQLVEPVTVLAALQDAGALSTAALGEAWGASAGLDAHAASTTGAHGGIVSATDARLTDARTPTAHAASHGSGGSDPVSPAAIGAAAVAHGHDGAAITSGTITPARLGTGSPAADRVLTGDGAWSPLPTAMGAWTPLPDTVYPAPADLGGHDGLTALPTAGPTIGETWWSWRDAQGPWAIAQIGLSISALGATPSAFRLHVHSRSTSGRPGTQLWVAPATITPTATGILWLTLAAPLVVPAWTVFGVGVQCVSGGTTVLHVTPRRQEPTAPTAAVATNNTYRWLSTGTTTPLGDSPPVSIGPAAPAKVLIRTAA